MLKAFFFVIKSIYWTEGVQNGHSLTQSRQTSAKKQGKEERKILAKNCIRAEAVVYITYQVRIQFFENIFRSSFPCFFANVCRDCVNEGPFWTHTYFLNLLYEFVFSLGKICDSTCIFLVAFCKNLFSTLLWNLNEKFIKFTQ